MKQLFANTRLDRTEEVRRLFTAGEVPVDTVDAASGDTALILACRLGHADMVDLCLELGQSPLTWDPWIPFTACRH